MQQKKFSHCASERERELFYFLKNIFFNFSIFSMILTLKIFKKNSRKIRKFVFKIVLIILNSVNNAFIIFLCK